MLHRLISSLRSYPAGLVLLSLAALVSSALILLREPGAKAEVELWTFNRDRSVLYQDALRGWEDTQPFSVDVQVVELMALERRFMSGFFAGTPVADVLELERNVAPRAWRGPHDAAGFKDLRPLLERDGLLGRLTQASYSPWNDRGRQFGLPLDVHPVLLAYRSDIFEEAGIDAASLDTWDRFFDATRSLVRDFDGDGVLDRYVFELPALDSAIALAMVLQAGVDLFDAAGEPQMTHPVIAEVLCRMADWASPPDILAGDVSMNSGSGNILRSQGFVLAWLAPDWRTRWMIKQMPDLAGKMKLMPLPAWREGGARTSVWGGTMLGLHADGDNVEEGWQLAKHLVFNREIARRSWSELRIVTPVKEFWDDPAFDEPVPFFCGQPAGRMYLDYADQVPLRSSSVFYSGAMGELGTVLNRLIRHATRHEVADHRDLLPVAEALLAEAQENMRRQMERTMR